MATSNNPILTQVDTWGQTRVVGETVTVRGTVAKAAGLLGLVAASAGWSWWNIATETAMGSTLEQYVLGACLVALGLGIYTRFRPQHAGVTAPIYALLEGIILGVISALMNAKYAGLPMQAVALTAGTFGVMLVAYRTKAIVVTDRFRAIMTGMIGGIFVFYLIAFALGLFGLRIPFLHEGGVIGIGFSLFVTGLAAFTLLLDFDAIDQSAGQLSKEYEWALAFGLVVTLIWLYLEFLRLLNKLRR